MPQISDAADGRFVARRATGGDHVEHKLCRFALLPPDAVCESSRAKTRNNDSFRATQDPTLTKLRRERMIP